jgi:transcriptional regulator with XRE-family HTH domain
MADRPSTFADRLRRLREAAGLSQYALAKLSGLSKQSLSRLELGMREPAWDTVQRLALALGVDYAAFADPNLTLPEPKPSRGPGRPSKVEAPPSKRRKKEK